MIKFGVLLKNFDLIISTIVELACVFFFLTQGLPFLAVFSFYALQRIFFWIFEFGKFTFGMLAFEKPQRMPFIFICLVFVFVLLLSLLNMAFFEVYYFATQLSSGFSILTFFTNLPISLYPLLLIGIAGFAISFVYYCVAKKYKEIDFVVATYNSVVSLPLMIFLTLFIAFIFAFFRNDILVVSAFIVTTIIVDKGISLLLRKLLGNNPKRMSEKEKEIRSFKW